MIWKFINKNYKQSLRELDENSSTLALAKDLKSKKILMFGWELPPYNTGGLGVACYEIIKELANKNNKVTFVLPEKNNFNIDFAEILFANKKGIGIEEIDSTSPYNKPSRQDRYGNSIMDKVMAYAKSGKKIAKSVEHDVIHAHDWLTIPVALKAKAASGKPLILHIHATEFDRSANGPINQEVYDLEKEGMEKADMVIAVSNFTKQRLIEKYFIPEEKIEVVHNGVNTDHYKSAQKYFDELKKGGKKIVLYLGRITIQKGPDYFIQAAARVLEKDENVIFIIAGTGDMQQEIINKSAAMAIADHILFTGYLSDEQIKSIYKSADLYIMPSVSEPFGIVALEALASKTPVIISKQSGASEAIENALKVDFWDTDEMANMILAILENPSLSKCLKEFGSTEVKNKTWEQSAYKLMNVYNYLAN